MCEDPIIQINFNQQNYSDYTKQYFQNLSISITCFSWISCYKQVCKIESMSNGHRFFFIFSGTLLFGFVFLFGITILPIFCGLRYLCIKVKEPQPPQKPTPPQKPIKPEEPRIGSSQDEWNKYRESMTEYRKSKEKFKEDTEYYKENQTQLMAAYEKKLYQHRKSIKNYESNIRSPAKAAFCNTCTNTTLHIMFCKEALPPIMLPFLIRYQPPSS